MIVRVWERVASMRAASRVVVATDSEVVARTAMAAGAEVVMTRPDHRSGTDRVAEVAGRQEYAKFNVIVNVQGDEPYITADAVRGAAGFVENGIFPLGTAACHATPDALLNASTVKVVTDVHDRALYFSRAPIPFLRDEAEHGTELIFVRAVRGLAIGRP